MGGSVLGVDMHAWAATMLAFVCPPAGPAVRRRGLAGACGCERLEAVDPFIHTWLGPPDPRRLLEARQRLRGLRRDRRRRPRRRRLARPVPRHRAPARRAPARRPGAGPDRPLVAPVPGPRPAAGPGDRLPPGDAALVGPAPEGRGHRRHGRAPAALLDQRRRTRRPPSTPSCPAAGSATRPGRRRTSRPSPHRPRRRPGRRALPAAHRRGRRPVLPLRQRRRPAARPAGGGRRSVCFEFAVADDPVESSGAPRSRCGCDRTCRAGRSSPGSATSRRTGPRPWSPAAR